MIIPAVAEKEKQVTFTLIFKIPGEREGAPSTEQFSVFSAP